jgi:predicted N-acyltransferase
MMKETSDMELRWVKSIRDIEKSAWDELAQPADTPFLEYDWLALLETSRSITPRTGWEPNFLTGWRNGQLVAACPLYRKTQSEGEFVYDYFWAEAADTMGLKYFPKLVGMSPVTPVSAFQFLIREGEARGEMVTALHAEMRRYCRAEKIMGIHLQYTHPAWVTPFTEAGFSLWEHPCYLWKNEGYRTFDDFLAVFSKNGRRNIRREEKNLAGLGITVRVLSGEEIPTDWYKIMFRYYLATNEKFGPWACLYLTEDFFKGIFLQFRHRLALSCAFREGETEPVGMALLLWKGGRLWGRYWGCAEYVRDMHFNVCYYAPIRWAIERGLQSYDPGIGGEHKVLRGFRAVAGASLHSFPDERFDAVFKGNIWKINARTRKMIQELNGAVVLKEKGQGERN